MIDIDKKLAILRSGAKQRKIKIMILGLGSVGSYLLDYLMSSGDDGIEITVVGRNADKLESDVNIIKVASLIRQQNRTDIKIVSGIDFDDVASLEKCFKENTPDIIVNSSRAYSGLKYGSISWSNIRAYGIWAPLSIKYVKNIMQAYENVESSAVVINTSYSDAVIPWLKTAGRAYPDFGSGNLNHLVPRIKFALASIYGIKDYYNIDITYATSHFHDVVISKEGQTEGVEQLIRASYRGDELKADYPEVFSLCKIQMPVDAKRNMMNASSDFEIIRAILDAVRDGKRTKLHCPGVFGEIGGYPIIVDGSTDNPRVYIDTSVFSLDDMRKKNRESIYLDGIKDVSDGTLIYTPELIQKVENAFGVMLTSKVPFEKIDETAEFLIKEIIEKNKA